MGADGAITVWRADTCQHDIVHGRHGGSSCCVLFAAKLSLVIARMGVKAVTFGQVQKILAKAVSDFDTLCRERPECAGGGFVPEFVSDAAKLAGAEIDFVVKETLHTLVSLRARLSQVADAAVWVAIMTAPKTETSGDTFLLMGEPGSAVVADSHTHSGVTPHGTVVARCSGKTDCGVDRMDL